MHNADVSDFACYLSWSMPNESRLLIDAILDEFHQARHEDHAFAGLQRLTEAVLGMPDNHQQLRLQLFLHGEHVTHRVGGVVQNEAPLPGFVELLVSQATNVYKRLILLKWLVNLHDVAERPNFMQPLPEVMAPVLLVRALRSQPSSLPE